MPKRNIGLLVVEYIKKYPDHVPTLTIAKRLHKDHPNIFKDAEHARTRIRYYRGNKGPDARKNVMNTSPDTVRKNQKAGWKFPLPPTKAEAWTNYICDHRKTLVLGDLHIPFHDPKSIDAVIKFSIKYKPNLILFNGDLADCYSLSRWVKNPKLRNFPEELETIKAFFEYIRERFKCDIVWKLGNHEERYEKYMFVRAPDLVGTAAWEFKNLADCDKYGIQIVSDKRIIMLGKLPVVHGHEFASSFSSPVNPARGLFLRTVATALTSHWHRTSDHNERNLMGKVITTYSTGCLCDLYPDYAKLNKWNSGFACVQLDKEGMFSVENYRIADGKIL